jgi:hypothetical protein
LTTSRIVYWNIAGKKVMMAGDIIIRDIPMMNAGIDGWKCPGIEKHF